MKPDDLAAVTTFIFIAVFVLIGVALIDLAAILDSKEKDK